MLFFSSPQWAVYIRNLAYAGKSVKFENYDYSVVVLWNLKEIAQHSNCKKKSPTQNLTTFLVMLVHLSLILPFFKEKYDNSHADMLHKAWVKAY